MLVSQLTELLAKQPQHKEVMMDISPSQADYFLFAPVVDVDEGQLDEESDETVILLVPFRLDEAPNEPQTAKYN